MKTFARLFVLALFLLALPLVVVNAQDNGIAEDVSGLFIQSATGGGFAETGDNVYTLTLTEVGANTPWAFSSPEFRTGWYPSVGFAFDWAASPDVLVGAAVIQLDEETAVPLLLSDPEYDIDSSTLTYQANVDADRLSAEDFAALKPPTTFTAVTVFIQIDKDFADGLVLGRESAGTRPVQNPWP